MAAGSGAAAPLDREGPLRRAISRRMLLFFIIGAGIYALVGEVGGAIWIAFTVALVLALCTAFAYAELVTKYPHAGGAALFVHRAYHLHAALPPAPAPRHRRCALAREPLPVRPDSGARLGPARDVKHQTNAEAAIGTANP